ALFAPGSKPGYGETNNGVTLTYRQFREETDRLALFIKNKGVICGSLVGVVLDRSIEMVGGIFAVLKAGGAYLPLLPEYPEERKQYILKDSGAKIVITTRDVYKKPGIPGVETVYIDEEIGSVGARRAVPEPTPSAGGLAYVIYTSGSTGKPKGVVVEHRSVVNILTDLQKKYPLNESDTYFLKTSYVFDVSVAELFGWFFAGGRLAVLKKGGEKDPGEIITAIERTAVTHINFVPSMFNAFVDELKEENIHKLSTLKYIFLAGEALLPELVDKFRRFNTGIVLEDIYGPTEGTIYSSYFSLTRWQDGTSIPIGKPVQNVELYILDKDNNMQPIGVPGELCIAGKNLARGYLNQPELTAEKFVSGGVGSDFLYKTGDLARWLPDGDVEYLGRLDYQVKIRGYRIELGEIESQLLKHEDVKEAVVIARDDKAGDNYLCAYIVAKNPDHVGANFRQYLARTLPTYMIPAHFVEIEELPLTPTGKIDRKTLPEPEIKTGSGYAAPTNETEKRLVAIWADVLRIDMSVSGVDDNFFESGGHSLKVTRLLGRVHKEFNTEVPFSQIFKTPTVRGLASYINQTEKSKYSGLKAAKVKEYYPLPPAQKRLYVLQQMEPDSRAYNMPAVLSMEGKIDREKFEQVFKKLIARHESLRTSFTMIDEQPVQKIHKPEDIEFKIEDYEPTPPLYSTDEVIDRFIRPFDLTQAPLLRAGLINIETENNILLVDMHHIISDGSSLALFIKEFISIYKGEELPPLAYRYKDYSEWVNSDKGENVFKEQETFWLEQFAGTIPVLHLPLDYPRP
ncbi:MAG: amino acid adenylation domain-containing protein, partial [Candidatus Aminicenantes bacterium]|nr:amino acid adenylation domain-containing protein [Candidatus Aminicenantes bacterium]